MTGPVKQMMVSNLRSVLSAKLLLEGGDGAPRSLLLLLAGRRLPLS